MSPAFFDPIPSFLKQLQDRTKASNFRQGQGRLTRISPKQISTEPRTGFVVSIVCFALGGGGGVVVVRHFKEFSKVKQQKTKVSHSASLHCSIHNSHNCPVTLQLQMTVAIKTMFSKIASFNLVLKCKLGQGDIKG